MRLHIQFGPDASRVAKAMLKNFPAVKTLIANAGAEYIIFDTTNPKLAAFCTQAFGFTQLGDTNNYVLLLPGDSNGQSVH